MSSKVKSSLPPIVSDWLSGGGEMGTLIRETDWAQTPLGPLEFWSPSLKMMVRFLLANRFPMLLWWGPQFIQIYNDAYRPVLGAKHPVPGLGRSVSECWSETWHILRPLIETPFHGGPPTWMEDILLEVNRHGFMEETHFTIAYSPVPDETVSSGIGGVLATVHEISEKIVSERRIVILRDLGTRAVGAKTAEEACAAAAATLAKHPRDVPFALLYLIDLDGRRARLAGATGVAPGSPISPAVIELDHPSGTEQAWPLSEVARTEDLQIVEDLAGRFGDAVPPGPWSDPPRQAVVAPIHSNIAHQPAGLLVVGISSRLRFDDSYRRFIELAAGQVATTVANARAYEEERKRAESLAELDRAKTAFFSNVSHEFRTPLALMLGPLEDTLSEDRLQLAVQTARIVVWDWLPQTNQVTTSENISDIYGIRAVEYAEQGFALLHPDDVERHRAIVERTVSEGGSYHSEFRIIRPDTKAVVWIEERAKAITNREGRVVRLVGVATDITARKSQEEEIRRLNEEMRAQLDDLNTLLEILPVGVWIGNKDCSQITGNPAAYQFMGFTPGINASVTTDDPEVPSGLRIFVDGQEVAPEDAPMQQVARTGKAWHNFEHEVLFPDGTRKSVYGSIAPLFDKNGAVRKVLGAYADFTDKKRAETEREELFAREQAARAEAQEANRLKDEFLATLSHELRNPLNSITGYAEVLRRSPEASQFPIVRQTADTIRRNAEAQARLINDLLDLSRLQTGKLAIDRRPMAIAPVIGDAVESVRAQAAAKQLALETEFPSGLLVVNADPVRVQQIVWNLVNNAVKFTPKGGRVSVGLSREGGEVKLVVEDTGQGIEAHFLPHVFEMFRQAEGGTTRVHGGMGIGLALVKQLVELHDGQIEAFSEGKGRGARFTVKLPLHTGASLEQAEPSRAENALSGARILIVDDSSDSLEMLRILFSKEGALVKTAGNGEEGLRQAEEEAKFDLIISDISMPEMDGYQFIKTLRESMPQYARIPAIALTGFGRKEDVERARQAGFTTHLTKPLEFDHLLWLARVTLGK